MIRNGLQASVSIWLLVSWKAMIFADAFILGCTHLSPVVTRTRSEISSMKMEREVPSWKEIESSLQPSFSTTRPVSIDSALNPSKPHFSTERPTLFRERHGWCPYSERVWLALEVKNIPYDTIRIDNTGHGARPSYFSGQTPQIRWADGSHQGESMDIVFDVQHRYPHDGPDLYPMDLQSDIDSKVKAFSSIFPRKARPSSRAAFLFRYNGEPLFRSEFESVLKQTDALLASQSSGPYFCGSSLTAADIAWAPFLERYAAQLPCLHQQLHPRTDSASYPHLVQWYNAMEQIPAYACRVKGDASSWAKVLSMAGYGNDGVPPTVLQRMDEEAQREGLSLSLDEKEGLQRVWDEYTSLRPWLAPSPGMEAASVIIRNRDLICKDAWSRGASTAGKGFPDTEEELEHSMRALVSILSKDIGDHDGDGDHDDDTVKEVARWKQVSGVPALASFLDQRMCVPRDMGSMSAACIKRLAHELA